MLDWSLILKRAGIPEPLGYLETCEQIRRNPYIPPKTKAKTEKKARKGRRPKWTSLKHGAD